MQAVVREQWVPFNNPFEGYLNYLYLDSKGYATTGMGNLTDSHAAMLALPWRYTSGALASPGDVIAEFDRIKSHTELAGHGGGAFERYTVLHLDDSAVASLIAGKLGEMENTLRGYFSNFANLPADAQMGLLSMAWAMGAAFAPKFPKFTRALNAMVPDFNTAAVESRMSDALPRNDANRTLFQNAAVVVAKNLDPTRLYYPQALDMGSSGAGGTSAGGYAASAADAAGAAGGGSVAKGFLVAASVAVGGYAAYLAYDLYKTRKAAHVHAIPHAIPHADTPYDTAPDAFHVEAAL